MKNSTLLLLLIGGYFLLSGDKKEKKEEEKDKQEPAPTNHSAAHPIGEKRTPTGTPIKTPKFLSGENLRHYKAIKKDFGSWGPEELERLQILEANLTRAEFDEVLLSLGQTRQGWDILIFAKNQLGQ